MTDITAEIIADSIGVHAPRLTTLKLRYPRFIHAELMTHRVLSRNARSSRAVPIAKMIQECVENPVIPLHWGAAQAGMQAHAENDNVVSFKRSGGIVTADREYAWLAARDNAVEMAHAFMEAGYAKQLVNRLLEPFLHIDVLVTATEWSNWFALRDHEDAEPHIRMLARAMRVAMDGSTPQKLGKGDWHLPYITDKDREEIGDTDRLRKVSEARCARISYTPFRGESLIGADMILANNLAKKGHWSPFEHQATPDGGMMLGTWQWANPRDHGNFVGWRQNRRIVEREVRETA